MDVPIPFPEPPISPFLQADPVTAAADGAVPLTRSFTNARELELVAEVLGSGQLGRGPMVTRFEEALATFVGARHALAMASGIEALAAAAATAGWSAHDEVLMSPFTHASAIQVARSTGATVRAVDVDPSTFALDVAAVEDAIGDRTRGIVATDAFGWPAETATLAAVAERHGLSVVEDARGALGASVDGRAAGASGVPAVFGFGASRPLTTGAGGMLVTDDDDVAARWRELLLQGRHEAMGGVAAAVGMAQLEKLPRTLAMRQLVAFEYTRLLADVQGLTTPRADGNGRSRSWGAYWILVDGAVDRSVLLARLAARGIECRAPRTVLSAAAGSLPVAESVGERLVSIPFFPHLSPQQQQRVVTELRDALAAG